MTLHYTSVDMTHSILQLLLDYPIKQLSTFDKLLFHTISDRTLSIIQLWEETPFYN